MKWFQMDANAPTQPTYRRILRRLGRNGLGSFLLLQCYVAEHSPAGQPGRAVSHTGEPIATDDLIDAAQCSEEEFDDLVAILLETEEIDADRWHANRELFFPLMAQKADPYTRRVLASQEGAANVRTPAEHSDPSLLSCTVGSSSVQEEPEDGGELLLFPVPATADQLAEQVRALWNAAMPDGMPKCQAITDARRRHIRRRLKERSIDDWRDVFARIAVSPFCTGQNDRGWRASFDWVIGSPDVAVKVLEGKYDARRAVPAIKPGQTGAPSVGKYARNVRRSGGAQ